MCESLRRFSGCIALAGFWPIRPLRATVPETPAAAAEPMRVKSPDGTIEVTVNVDGPLRYSVTVDGQPIVQDARLGLKLREGTMLGADVGLSSSSTRSEDSTWENPLGKRRVVQNQYRELSLLLNERSAKDRAFQVIIRAFDDGVAFRYVLLSQPGMRDFVLEQDLTEFRFPADATCWAGEIRTNFDCSQEWEFRRQRLSDITPDSVKGLPVLVETPAAWVAIAEADLLDWSGMWIGGKPQGRGKREAPLLPNTAERHSRPRRRSRSSPNSLRGSTARDSSKPTRRIRPRGVC